jgi:branched-chain amino acid transport system substrate-binding protein
MGSGINAIKVWLIVVIPFTIIIEANAGNAYSADTVNLGLLVRTPADRPAVEGAMLAAKRANKASGQGMYFNIIVKSMEGPWGTGSKMAVDLIFDHRVAAIISAVDGRNSHLVEQACTKTRVVMVSALASDPTLSQAYVPWFFNSVPNDSQQADALVDEIFTKQKLNKVIAVFDSDYDSGFALKYFRMKLRNSGFKSGEIAVTGLGKGENERIAEKIAGSATDGVVLFCKSTLARELTYAIEKLNPKIRIFATALASYADSGNNMEPDSFMKKITVPVSEFDVTSFVAFRELYTAEYNKKPCMWASYAYDATTLIINAINEAGSERENIQPWLYSNNFKGVTGIFSFDKMGNRKGSVVIRSPYEITNTEPGNKTVK